MDRPGRSHPCPHPFPSSNQTALTGIIGATVGTAVGATVVWRLTDQAPDPNFTLAVATLAVIATITAALPPALVAAHRDPVKVLRVP